MDIERKSLGWEVKALDEGSGAFSVYASVFNNVDRTGEVVAPGAFKNLDSFVAEGWGALNHDWAGLPVAMVDGAEQDPTGLLVRGRFHSHRKAQDCRTVVVERIAAGKSVKASIGYRVLEDGMEERGGRAVRVLKQIELYEFSFVNMPANPRAEVVGAKRLITADEARDLVGALEDRLAAGGSLSDANLAAVKAWSGSCRDLAALADALDAFCEKHGPRADADATTTTPPAGSPAGLYPAFLANAARYPDYLLKGDR